MMGDTTESTLQGPLTDDELDRINAYWRTANYLTVGQIYLLDNPLLREPLLPEHVKPRLLRPRPGSRWPRPTCTAVVASASGTGPAPTCALNPTSCPPAPTRTRGGVATHK